MRTPRTVDEIADGILPADGDGIHERALCLLLAEHERDIAELYARHECPADVGVTANCARCESGEEGRGAKETLSSAAASAQRAPDSIVPTAEEVAADTAVLCSRRPNLARSRRKLMAMHLNALAADRDHWREARRASDEAARVEIDRLKRELAASDRALVNECNRLEAARDRSMALWERSYLLCEKVMAERDALQRRIDAMAAREPTEDEISNVISNMAGSGTLTTAEQRAALRGEVRAFCNAWRDQLLATPASEPSEGQFVPPSSEHVDELLREGAALGKEARERVRHQGGAGQSTQGAAKAPEEEIKMTPVESILRHFAFAHLPERLRAVSRPICELAQTMASTLPMDPELTAGLRKLLEAKDCFVRAELARPRAE